MDLHPFSSSYQGPEPEALMSREQVHPRTRHPPDQRFGRYGTCNPPLARFPHARYLRYMNIHKRLFLVALAISSPLALHTLGIAHASNSTPGGCIRPVDDEPCGCDLDFGGDYLDPCACAPMITGGTLSQAICTPMPACGWLSPATCSVTIESLLLDCPGEENDVEYTNLCFSAPCGVEDTQIFRCPLNAENFLILTLSCSEDCTIVGQ